MVSSDLSYSLACVLCARELFLNLFFITTLLRNLFRFAPHCPHIMKFYYYRNRLCIAQAIIIAKFFSSPPPKRANFQQ